MPVRLKTLGAALLAVLAAGVASAPRALAATPRLMVYYVEAAPVIEVLRESGRPSRMAVVEQWRDLSPAKADARTKALQARIGRNLQAAIDDRLSDPLAPLDFIIAPAGVFHVLMHIDVIPDGSAAASKALQAQKASVMAARGALAFEAATQVGRPNHFAVHEVWKTRAAYEAYAASPAGEDLRRAFTPYKGAPFDDRFYGP
jgi:quinol monooxygenase YgiN